MLSGSTIYRIANATRGTELADRSERAGTSNARRRGLLGRDSLPEGTALLIAPCEAIHTFGMRFAIDVVFLSRDRRVVKVAHNVKPWRIAFCLRAHSALELPAGTAAKTRTQSGDRLDFCLLDG